MELVARHFGAVLELQTKLMADNRGSFQVVFNQDLATELGMTDPFVQDNHSTSASTGTVRGLHLQVKPNAQGKLVRVSRGAILDVAVDLRPGSSTHLQHVAVELSADNRKQLFVPRGFAHGFCTLAPDTEVLYKVDGDWDPHAERTIRWDDPAVGIDWPVSAADATLSDKDRNGPPLSDFLSEFPT